MSDVQSHLGHAAFAPHPWPHIALDRKGRAIGKRRLVKPKRVAKRGRRRKIDL